MARKFFVMLVTAVVMAFALGAAALASDEVGPSPTPSEQYAVDGEACAVYNGEDDTEFVETEEMKRERQFSEYIKQLYVGLWPGFGGTWVEQGADSEDVCVIAVTDAFNQGRFVDLMESIFYTSYRFQTVKHTYSELMDIFYAINEDLNSDPDANIAVMASVSEKENLVQIQIHPNSDEKLIAEKKAKYAALYGDKIEIEVAAFDKALTAITDSGETEYLGLPSTYTIGGFTKETMNPGGTVSQYMGKLDILSAPQKTASKSPAQRNIVVFAVLAMAACIAVGFAYGIKNQRSLVRVSADGREIAGSRSYSDSEIEALVKKAEPELSDAARDRIFAAYDKETQGK